MKIAFISDIHSNFFYLKEVLLKIEQEDVDEIYCLGDLVGYYNQPNEVIDLIKEKKITCIKGNHEKYLLGELEYNHKNESIYGIKKQKKIITQNNYNFLNSLPDFIELEVSNKLLYLTHSLPDNSTSYVYNPNDLNKNFITKYDFYCYGHTHIPLISYQFGTCVINSGSVGQPRDYSKMPSFVILDTNENSVELKKIEVDYKNYSKHLESDGYDNSLIKILIRGKNEKN